MKLYISKTKTVGANPIVLDDMILTEDFPTTAGSKMLDGYKSPFTATVAERLNAAGCSVAGKANVGEFGIDLLGETSYFGAVTDTQGRLTLASAELVRSGGAKAAVCLDTNGAQRRAAALSNLVYIKPTYGTVSRYGTVSVASSGECVGVTARTVADCKAVLDTVVGHDDKDGTSLPEEKCALVKNGAASLKKAAIVKSLTANVGADTAAKIDAARAAFTASGITVSEIDCDVLTHARTAWGALMCAELCSNLSRYDGVKYGHRSENHTTLDELYTKSRTEGFGALIKTAILYGSAVLSEDCYTPVYDKALRVRRVITEALARLHGEYDVLIIPACSKNAYTLDDVAASKHLPFDEALYTAPASISGLPAAVAGGVQLIGAPFTESTLFEAAAVVAKEGE